MDLTASSRDVFRLTWLSHPLLLYQCLLSEIICICRSVDQQQHFLALLAVA